MFSDIITTLSYGGCTGCPALSRGLVECGFVVSHYNLGSATHWWQMPFEAREGGCLGCSDKLRSPWLFVGPRQEAHTCSTSGYPSALTY